MVCLGNICRSPLAEGVMRDKIEKHKLNATVDSCGMGGWHVGEAPDYRARQTALAHGIDISRHKGRKFSRNDFDNFDIIYGMDKENYEDILALARTEQERQKVNMLMDELYPGQQRPIPDPYYGEMSDFENAWKMIDEACEAAARKLQVNDGN